MLFFIFQVITELNFWQILKWGKFRFRQKKFWPRNRYRDLILVLVADTETRFRSYTTKQYLHNIDINKEQTLVDRKKTFAFGVGGLICIKNMTVQRHIAVKLLQYLFMLVVSLLFLQINKTTIAHDEPFTSLLKFIYFEKNNDGTIL